MSTKSDTELGQKIGPVSNGEDPLNRKLDLVLEELNEQRDLLEELVEKVSDLGTPSIGYGYD